MTQYLFSLRARLVAACGIASFLLAAAASPAMALEGSGTAPVAMDATSCTYPQLSQAFAWANDSRWYTLTPGQSVDNFDGSGWTLTGGAQVVTTDLANGSTGQVLDLPSGSRAVSPTICVDSGFQVARTMVRNVIGGEGVQFYVSYSGTATWDQPKNTGQVHGKQNSWTPSDPVNVQPSNVPGWQLVRFTFVPGGKSSEFQIYNFYVDPRMKG